MTKLQQIKKAIVIIWCMIAIQQLSIAQIENIKGEALSSAEKKKMADTLQGWKFMDLGGITFNQAGFKTGRRRNKLYFILFNLSFLCRFKKGKITYGKLAAAEYGIQISKEPILK